MDHHKHHHGMEHKPKHFVGTYTSIVTPFEEARTSKQIRVDSASFKNLVRRQIEAEVNGIVIGGTTGEGSSLDAEEYILLLNHANEVRADMSAQHKFDIIACTGTNVTYKTIDLTKEILKSVVGSLEGILVVVPYYNRPTQTGIYEHFATIAHEFPHLPIIVYNIPYRTAVNINPQTLQKLVENHPNIAAIKEASADDTQIDGVLAIEREGFSVLSGNDDKTYGVGIRGGKGVISVTANVFPEKVVAMVRNILDIDMRELAARQDHDLYQVNRALFLETNPIPVKAALAHMGLIQEVYRLPMTKMNEHHKLGELTAVIDKCIHFGYK